MAKTCTKEDCSNPRFGGGYCKNHGYLRTDKKLKRLRQKDSGLSYTTRKKKPIKPISDKRKVQMAEYHKVRLDYLNLHRKCEYEGCNKNATEIHHMAARNGDRLTDAQYFMAICRPHHQHLHLHPIESRERGYLI